MIRVSAPGKAILMGEHAAVYGRPALVAALDRRVYVRLERTPGPPERVILDLPALGVEVTTTWAELRASAERSGLDASDRSSFVRAAFGEALAAADFAPKTAGFDHALRVRIRSEFPVGSGFGSSAAIAVAVVRAVFELAGRETDDSELHAVSLKIEQRQHGSPSGIDNATVIHGGVVWVERRGANLHSSLHVEPLQTTSNLFDHLRIYQTGEPAESTGEVVSAVRRLRSRDERAFEQRLDVMAASTLAFRQLLERQSPESGSRDRLASALGHFRRFQSCLEAIGVVPPEVRERIRRIEASGGAAKISGAGSLEGPGAGSLLVLHPEPGILDSLDALDDFERLEVRLGGDGLRVESEMGGAE